jgi:hypothetical protein
LRDLDIERRIILKMILRQHGVSLRAGFMCPRTQFNGGFTVNKVIHLRDPFQSREYLVQHRGCINVKRRTLLHGGLLDTRGEISCIGQVQVGTGEGM